MEKLILSNIELEELVSAIAEDVADKLLPVILEKVKKEETPIYIKPSVAAKIIGMSESFVRKLVRERKLTAYYPGSDQMIKKSELLAYMESRAVKF